MTDSGVENERLVALRLEGWFARFQRPLPWRDEYRPYHIWVSEVMLQQTRMEVVLQYFERFLRRFPSINALADSDLDEVLTAWSGLGYYRRARMLHKSAQLVRDRFAGELPQDFDVLLSLPGIGRYTAGAISSIAFNQPRPIVDGNVARILARLAGLGDPLGSRALASAEWSLAEQLVKASDSPRKFNQAMMEVGALICRPSSPLCSVCPLNDICVAFRTGTVNRLPVPPVRSPSRVLEIPLYLISDDRGALLMRKEAGPLMTDMFHLPHGSTALLEGVPLSNVAAELPLGRFRHTVTNRRIQFLVHRATLPANYLANGPDEYAWIHPGALETVPHPSYVRKALRLAGLI